MKSIDENQRNRYFTELAVALKCEGLETSPLKDGQLPVLMDGQPICQISGGGSVRYRPENMITETSLIRVISVISGVKDIVRSLMPHRKTVSSLLIIVQQ